MEHTKDIDRYRGPLKAVFFDWAGTVIDYGSCAPAGAFIQAFAAEGIAITAAEARAPMGMAKRAHIEAIFQQPAVAQRWLTAHRVGPTAADIDRFYARFLPLQMGCLADYSVMIPGAVETVDACRRRGLKIGSSTGYVQELMDVVMPLASAAGYTPDAMVCASDVQAGRPAPWLNQELAHRLDVFPPAAIVVVDDTPVGIAAGRNAAMWTVAVVKSGNEMGLNQREVDALAPPESATRLIEIRNRLCQCGAHYTIDTVAELLPVLDDIEHRLADGEQP